MKAPATTIFSLFLFLSAYSCYAEIQTLKLSIPDFKPFTYSQNGAPKGTGVEKVSIVLDRLGWPYELIPTPNYGRALAEVKANRSHGFFLASENSQRNSVAVFSEPILFNRWSWFYLNNEFTPEHPDFKEKALLGTILNTNTHRWLDKNSYNVLHASADPMHLIRLMTNQRLDAVFLAELVFLEAHQSKSGLPKFEQKVEINKPMGIYIAKKYLKNHPGFMAKLNKEILLLTAHD